MVDDVPQDDPRRQNGGSSAAAHRARRRELLGRERRQMRAENAVGMVENTLGIVNGRHRRFRQILGHRLTEEAQSQPSVTWAICTTVEHTDDQPGIGSAAYCSAVSLRQATSMWALAQRLKAKSEGKSSFMSAVLACADEPHRLEFSVPTRLTRSPLGIERGLQLNPADLGWCRVESLESTAGTPSMAYRFAKGYNARSRRPGSSATRRGQRGPN